MNIANKKVDSLSYKWGSPEFEIIGIWSSYGNFANAYYLCNDGSTHGISSGVDLHVRLFKNL